MLAFVLPFKPKSQSKDWRKDCALLEATINSLLNQSSKNYKIYIVYYDYPDLEIKNQNNISFIHYGNPFIDFENTPAAAESEYRTAKDKIIVARRWDKSRKIFLGCKIAKEEGCNYIMSVDADDLISNKLVGYIDARIKENEVPGFYINKGYLYRPSSKRMIRVNKNMQGFNGSTHILRSDLIKIPDFESGNYLDFNLFTSHGWIVDRMKQEHNVDMESIPFPAVIYVAHGGNVSDVSKLDFMGTLKYLIKLLVRGKWITKSVKKEFSI